MRLGCWPRFTVHSSVWQLKEQQKVLHRAQIFGKVHTPYQPPPRSTVTAGGSTSVA